MAATYLIILLIGAAGTTGTAWLRIRRPMRRAPTLPGIGALCLLLCTSFAVQLGIVQTAVGHAEHLSPLASQLPIALLNAGFLYTNDFSPIDSTTLEILDLAQCAALLLLAMALRGVTWTPGLRFVIGVSALALAALALRAPAMECPDLYSYVGLAQAGMHPYHPAAVPLPGDEAIVNKLWGLPLAPSPYGPLWIAISRAALGPLPTLAAKLYALRATGAVTIALCLALLAALKKFPVLIALVAVNPAIYQVFVAEGHNDILGVVFLLGAAVLRTRAPMLAVIVAACAGMVKLPYLLIAPLVFAAESTARRRITLGLVSGAITLTVSAVAGGPWYAWALHRVYLLYAEPIAPIEVLLHAAVAALAIAAVLSAVVFRRFIPGLSWSNLGLGQFALPQYLAWCFPYALLTDEPNLVFFVTLPIALYVLNIDYTLTPLLIATRALLIAVAAIGLIGALRFHMRRRLSRTAEALR